jgi:hypothetical protein
LLVLVAPPPAGFSAELLAEAVRLAAATVAVPYPPVEEGPVRLARWGEQLDVRNVSRDGTELSVEAVAAYVAKYATKSTEALAGLDRRIHHDGDLDHLKVVPHLARLELRPRPLRPPVPRGRHGASGSAGRHGSCIDGTQTEHGRLERQRDTLSLIRLGRPELGGSSGAPQGLEPRTVASSELSGPSPDMQRPV